MSLWAYHISTIGNSCKAQCDLQYFLNRKRPAAGCTVLSSSDSARKLQRALEFKTVPNGQANARRTTIWVQGLFLPNDTVELKQVPTTAQPSFRVGWLSPVMMSSVRWLAAAWWLGSVMGQGSDNYDQGTFASAPSAPYNVGAGEWCRESNTSPG